MTLSTYGELMSAIADWLERADLAPRIPDFIRLAESQIDRVLREREMTCRASAIVSDPLSAAPGDLLDVRTLVLSDGEERWSLTPAPLELLDAAASGEAGRPQFWSLVGGELRYHPAPDREYTATLTYYVRVPPLGDHRPSNWLLVAHPDLYLFGALKEAAPFLRDATLTATFETKYRTAVEELRQARRTLVGPLRTEPELHRPYSSALPID
jgi:hypothetical protein